MKIHTTNYYNTLIEISDDCPANIGEVPPLKVDKPTIANIQFELISKNPYKFTSDDVLFKAYAIKNDLTEKEIDESKKLFFSKGQACFRASPLTKRYGWGVHSNSEGKIAIFGVESKEYEKLKSDNSTQTVKAMKTKR